MQYFQRADKYNKEFNTAISGVHYVEQSLESIQADLIKYPGYTLEMAQKRLFELANDLEKQVNAMRQFAIAVGQ